MRYGCKPHNPLSDRYMFEDAVGRPRDGKHLTLFPFLCLTGTELTGCLRSDLSVRLSTRRTGCPKNAPQNILNRVGSGNINVAEDFRSVFVRKQSMEHAAGAGNP